MDASFRPAPRRHDWTETNNLPAAPASTYASSVTRPTARNPGRAIESGRLAFPYMSVVKQGTYPAHTLAAAGTDSRLRGQRALADHLLQPLANAIVQSAGTDLYKECRKLLGQCLHRSSRRKDLESQLDISHQRLSIDPNLRTAEAARWAAKLQDLLTVRPAAEPELRKLHAELVNLLSKQQTSQFGFAGRDQYNIGGNATFKLRSNYRR
jgi:hypothetical protein